MLKQHLNIITRVSILVIIFFIFINWRQELLGTPSHQSIKFTFEHQHAKDDGKLVIVKDSLNMFFHDHYIAYMLPYTKMYFKGTLDKNQNEIGSKLVRVDTAYRYLIYKEKNKFGYQFDSVDFKKPEKLNIDTFRTNNLWKGFSFYQKNIDSLVESKPGTDENIMVKKYVCNHKLDDTFTDTMYFYFDKRMTGISFSLSPEMDSLTHSKLFKVLYIFNKVPKGKKYFGKSHGFDVPKREWTFEISRIPPESPTLTKFIEQFISKEKTLYNGN
jgi:hypothetical protein